MSYNNNHRNGPGPLPKRWLHCPRKSDGVIAERFVAFKTPLSVLFNEKVPPEFRFTPDMILGYCNSLKMKLGLWVDLTNTNRFYDRKMIEEKEIRYIKLQCRGHGETPSAEQTQSFIEIVDDFINDHPFELIGVHCTHGFNRTGFLIISYLIERLDWSLEAALSVFATARAPGIYKQDYIDELFRRYEAIEDTVEAPQMPEWCFAEDAEEGHSMMNNVSLKRPHEESDNEDYQEAEPDGSSNVNDNDLNDSSGNAHKKKRRRREMVIENAKFMSDIVRDVTLVTEQPLLGDLQLTVQEMCNWNKSGFPGAQPVSINMENLKLLAKVPYRVSWKADGARYMMLVKDRNEIYFFDRNHSCFRVDNLSFVKAKKPMEHLKDTLLDGEMVLDKFEGQIFPRYLIYDVIKIEGRDIGKEPFFPNRLECIVKEIIEPRREAMRLGIIKREKEPFGVRDKQFWGIQESKALLGEKFAKQLSHEPDGLIFQPSEQPYTPGVCPDVFKWKPGDMNSIDFRLKIAYETGVGILRKKVGLLFVGGQDDKPFAQIKVNKTLSAYDNKIIECYRDKQGQWVFMRERTDKTLPNSYKTALSVLESIVHPVTKEILLDFIVRHGYREHRHNQMLPPTSNHVHRSLSQHQHQNQPHPMHHPQHQIHQNQPHQMHHPQHQVHHGQNRPPGSPQHYQQQQYQYPQSGQSQQQESQHHHSPTGEVSPHHDQQQQQQHPHQEYQPPQQHQMPY